MRTGRGRSGFTLIELMIVVVIIAGMAAIASGPLTDMRAGARQNSATNDLVDFVGLVRSQAESTRAAHMLRFRTQGDDSSNGLGKIDVHVGMHPFCRQTPWAQTYLAGGALAARLEPRQFYDMFNYNPATITSSSVTMPSVSDSESRTRLTAAIGGVETAGLLLCYQPNGEVLLANGHTAADTVRLEPQDVPVTFNITRWVGGRIVGRVRTVIFPPNGTARVF